MGLAVALGHGWAGDKLVATYETERQPVGMRAVNEALRDYDRLTSNTRYPNIADETEEGMRVRGELGARLSSANRRVWEPIGIHLGYRYDSSPIVVGDGTRPPEDDEFEYVPNARPGSRAPHAWLVDRRSTLDLFGRNFTLLCLGRNGHHASKLVEAAETCGMPLDVKHVPEPEVAELYGRSLVLVRPDGHVAWRGGRIDDPFRIVDAVRGA